MRSKQIDDCIELICQKGCLSVREDIRLLERGAVPPEIEVLDDLARQAVLKELRAIMAVYGDSCPMSVSGNVSSNGLEHGKKR